MKDCFQKKKPTLHRHNIAIKGTLMMGTWKRLNTETNQKLFSMNFKKR